MIAHLAPGVYLLVEAFAGLREDGEPHLTISIVVINVLASITARGHMVEATSKF